MFDPEKLLGLYCGNISSALWQSGSIGFCSGEVYFHVPAALILAITYFIYVIKFLPNLAFDCPYSKTISFRIALDCLMLCKSVSFLILSMIPHLFPYYICSYSINIGSTLFVSFCISLFDTVHGKANCSHSRGPLPLLLLEISYFYVSSLQLWSGLSQFRNSGNEIILACLIIDPILLGGRLLTKIPVTFPIENERLLRSRDLRQASPGTREDSTNQFTVQQPHYGFLRRLYRSVFFIWVNEIINKGYYGELYSFKPLPSLPRALSAAVLENTLHIKTTVAQVNSKFRAALPLVKQLISNFGKEILLLGFVKFVFSVLGLLSPVFLDKFVTDLSKASSNWRPAILWGIVMIVTRLACIFLGIAYDYLTPRFGYKVKISVSMLVYRQLMRRKASSLAHFSTGNLVNLLTTDAERVVNLTPSFNELWAMPVQLVVSVWLLYCQLGVSCFVGVGFLVVLLPLNRVITKLIGNLSAELMQHKDLRVKFVSEMLQSMAAVKLACWEKLIAKKILDARKNELRALRGQKMLDAVCVFLWAACPALLSSSTFTVYVALGNVLTPAKVFTSLSLFEMLIHPMNALPWVLSGVVESWISAGRICRLFEVDNASLVYANPSFNSENRTAEPSVPQADDFLKLKSSLLFWKSADTPTLTDIDVTISKGQLVGVVGPIASGKSSFLLALMGELQSTEPQSTPHDIRFAYVGSTPWLQKGSIRSNILFGEPLDPNWLDKVVDVCGLTDDLAEMPAGLDTEVGEGGSRLSGGQKARLALARAVYQKADVYLFDDPLSALDTHVAREIVRKCIGQGSVLANKTRIITTHRPEWLYNESDPELGGPADQIITMSDGKVVGNWMPKNRSNRPSRAELVSFSGEITNSDSVPGYASEESPEKEPLISILPRSEAEEENEESSNWEKIAFGSISSRVYLWYAKFMGFCLALSVFISLALMQASRNGQDYWLSYWMQQDERNATSPSIEPVAPLTNHSTWFYLTIYGGITGVNLVFTVFRAVLFAFAGLKAAAEVHKHMLHSVLQGEMSFFDSTPLGRILNRFSSDVGTIDDGLPFLLNILMAILFGLFGSLVITCLALPAIFIICLPLPFIYWSVQRVYRAAARDLKRLSSIARSPVYALLSETIGGLVLIRGLRKEAHFSETAGARLNTQTRCELAGLAATAWLNLRLQLVALLVVSGVIVCAIIGRLLALIDVSLAGLAVIYALNLANSMTSLVSVMSDSEKNFVAVERCRELTEETPFETDVVPLSDVPPLSHHHMPHPERCLSTKSQVGARWPEKGRIVFDNVHLVYPSDVAPFGLDREPEGSQFALKAINLTVEPGEHVAVVGRTGSGKSSLLRVLFRLVPHLDGAVSEPQTAQMRNFKGATGIVTVDGVDIRRVPLNILRSRMLCVSQDPFLFSGSVRENLDPENCYTDVQLTELLVRCGLVSRSADALTLLSTEVGEAGRSLSAGQRQLLCLARALFRQGPTHHAVICLDEATASLDNSCERKIQDMLVHEFADSTVLLVAHRLSTVLQCCSRVVVMSLGRIIEQGEPLRLAEDPASAFHKMLHSHEASLT